jgi:FkbM family methyltransferase
MKDTAIHFGWHLPAHEQHLQKWMANPKNVGDKMNGRPGYQLKKQRKALSYVKQFRTACDVGGHVGFHSFNMAHAFAQVHSFEPVALHRKCFELNTAGLTNITLHAVALGKVEGSVSMNTEVGSSGNTTVGGKGDIPMITLDSLGLEDVDYMKLDVEGWEANAILGAEQTIKTSHPVIMCEQKRTMSEAFGIPQKEAVAILLRWGYKEVAEISGDHILVWP